jgi:DNA primase catalytic core
MTDTLEAIRAGNDIVVVVSEYVRLKKSGVQLVGLCPFHTEKSPSFSVHPSKQVYHCYGCGAGGDVFRFVQEIERIPFMKAKNILAQRAGLTVKPSTKADRKVWAEKCDERELIEHFRLVEGVSQDRASIEFHSHCDADPGYRAWLEADLAQALALTSVLIGIIADVQKRDGFPSSVQAA